MRYAIYFVPHTASPLAAFGAGVLGYDLNLGTASSFHDHPMLRSPGWPGLTAAPRRYGFHATLKAPFELAAGLKEDDLVGAVANVAATLSRVDAGVLELSEQHGYFALRPVPNHHSGLAALAQACVEALDRFRAPLTDDDRRRRSPDRLNDRQRINLERWGYPYTEDEFRFHMTLTGNIGVAQRPEIGRALAALYRSVETPTPINELALCRQVGRDAPFKLLARYPLAE